jgi:hypothetical protein
VHALVRRTYEAIESNGAVKLTRDQRADKREELKAKLKKMSEVEASGQPGFRRLKDMARRYARQLHAIHSKPGKPDLLQLAYLRSKAKQGARGRPSTRRQ